MHPLRAMGKTCQDQRFVDDIGGRMQLHPEFPGGQLVHAAQYQVPPDILWTLTIRSKQRVHRSSRFRLSVHGIAVSG
jgi:hypothetical protein